MQLFGIQFAPWNVPFRRRLETASAATGFFLISLLGLIGPPFAIYLLLFTRLWFLAGAYMLWIWFIDNNISVTGGRPNSWLRNWKIWKYARDYYPVKLIKTFNGDLDPKRNYLFCAFPHGVFGTGIVISMATNACDVDKMFPNHVVQGLTLHTNFYLPIYRDFVLSLGMCSVSAKSINWLLQRPEGGRIGVLVVGGAAEAYYARPGDYNLVLKNRKGFVKLALRNGTPLVPVFTFGEIDIFDQLNNAKGTRLDRFQQWFKRTTGVLPIIPVGRGFFQYSFGIVPKRKPLNVVVGEPIEVTKTENPTQEDIDELHGKFVEKLTKLFEAHQDKYLENPTKTRLIIN